MAAAACEHELVLRQASADVAMKRMRAEVHQLRASLAKLQEQLKEQPRVPSDVDIEQPRQSIKSSSSFTRRSIESNLSMSSKRSANPPLSLVGRVFGAGNGSGAFLGCQ